MIIALVGGAGFVGHHLALALQERGHRPVIIDSLAVNNLYWLLKQRPLNQDHLAIVRERLELLRDREIEIRCLDARDYRKLSENLGWIKPDAIVHLAAIAHIDRANKDPYSTFDHALRTLENSLDFARAVSCPHFVYFSSSTVYGDFKKPVIDEQEPCHPWGIYGNLKLAGELMVQSYHQAFSLPYTIVRPCAVYGARCISGRVTQKFVEQALAGSPLVIDGDGSGRHDFTYIDDLISGVVKVLTEAKPMCRAVNLTAGGAFSLAELARIIAEEIPGTEIRFGPADPLKPSRGTMDIGLAKSRLGYSPQDNLKTGMKKYINWYREFHERRKRSAA